MKTEQFHWHIVVWSLIVIGLSDLVARSEDWPAYMHDNARSGITATTLAGPLAESWTYHSPVEPRTAWPPPQPGWTELPKVDFDDAFYTVSDRERVYFSSSVENKVVAIESATGNIRWQFFTSAPVRLAPTLAHGLVYFGSDDGRVYCVRCDTGELVWTFDAALRPDRVLGNGNVTSLWPVRTGVAVVGDRAYFGAGVFPYHRVFMVAVDARRGTLIWKRDDLQTYGGFSPQGYLLAAKDRLIVPSGRASPICLQQENGDLLFGVPHSNEKGGATGVYGTIVEDILYIGTQNTLFGSNVLTGKPSGSFPTSDKVLIQQQNLLLLKGPPAPAYGRRSIAGTKNEIHCYDRQAYRELPRKDAESVKKTLRWRVARPDAAAMILAGNHLIVGSKDQVAMIEMGTGKIVWEGRVDGLAVGLTVAHQRLFVSTNRGKVHCFAAEKLVSGNEAKQIQQHSPRTASSKDGDLSGAEKLVAEIVRATGVKRGFAVVLGDPTNNVACELARQTELRVTSVWHDQASLRAARETISATGLYGHRVTVEFGSPNQIPFPDYGANLVLQLEPAHEPSANGAELLRILKPCGGVLLAKFAEPDFAKTVPSSWRDAGTLDTKLELDKSQRWAKLVRSPLAGSGWWTHQFADAGNSGSSGDKLVKGKLEVLWFGEPGADEFPDRHQRGPAPLIHNGLVFCQGWNFLDRQTTLFCFDAYNGLRYWKRNVEGAIRLGLPAVAGNLACDETSVYIAAGPNCTRYSSATGETLATLQTPAREDGTRPDWNYLAVANGMVIGSSAENAKARFSDTLFAFDVATGKQQWLLKAKEVRDTTIAVQGSRLFYVENRQPSAETSGSQVRQLLLEGQAVPVPRTVVAVDLLSGRIAWERDVDLIDCGRWDNSMWGSLQMLCHDDVLVLAGAYTIYPSRSKAPPRPRMALALATSDGKILWNKEIGNRSRPVMMHDALLAEPVFFDLQSGNKIMKPRGNTGKETPWSMGPRTGGCGSLSASDCMVFGRGGYTVWRDIETGPSAAFVGTRPGCFINIIPAGGVVVQAEASSGCSCYQAIQCTVVFRPTPTNESP